MHHLRYDIEICWYLYFCNYNDSWQKHLIFEIRKKYVQIRNKFVISLNQRSICIISHMTAKSADICISITTMILDKNTWYLKFEKSTYKVGINCDMSLSKLYMHHLRYDNEICWYLFFCDYNDSWQDHLIFKIRKSTHKVWINLWHVLINDVYLSLAICQRNLLISVFL